MAAGQCTRDAAQGDPNSLCAQCAANPSNYCTGTCCTGGATCQGGSCVAATCPAGADYCTGPNGNCGPAGGSCTCSTTVGGAAFCAGTPAGCLVCTSDNDCATAGLPGTVCIVATCCGVAGMACVQPCAS